VPAGRLPAVTAAIARVPGMRGAITPPGWTHAGLTLIEAFPSSDSASSASWSTIGRLQQSALPGLQQQLGSGAQLRLAGAEPQGRDFEHTVYGNFPYVLLFVVVLTYVLLARAFRSLILPLKAVLLNLVSLGSAFGIVVFVFQQGHGSEAIWNVPATGVIISWIPLMIFAFLYGISMDDVTGDTRRSVVLGLERTGKLVTSAALILMFAFLVLSSSPGVDVKQFAIGLSAGIIFDATVIRALLVPALMTLLGRWNWWLPHPVARLLLVRRDATADERA